MKDCSTHRPVVEADELALAEARRTGDDRTVRRQQIENRPGGDRRAAAGLTDETKTPSSTNRQVDVTDRSRRNVSLPKGTVSRQMSSAAGSVDRRRSAASARQ